ncbi:hybrid sensor histidine kinase/response regulator (plasmid) [Methylobacterium sp. NMS14P]|uniref:ATP-binding response regulator n=1 Tax=Methylobacterium sp. NMS14P TaxID=2894310 RepID=UPI002358D282|nr:hybrid sensor histidine kinase/response regulator [Methylobacterium sp. NMS14P]WCS28802.1 hybrid sensor histidine kinase/response regulator [Methylobacterium sp. NMS14P]
MSPSQEDRIAAEQLRLVLDGVTQSVAVGFLVSTLMLAVLWTLVPHAVLLSWYGAFLVERFGAAAYARRVRDAVGEPDRARRVERVVFLSKIVEGAILGSLIWIALPLQIPAVSILTMSLLGATCSNGVSLLAPRRHLYLALVVPVAVLAAGTLWSLGGAPYRALAVCSILFVVGQYGQVVLASRRVRESIELRFENAALVEQLRAESAAAHRARRDAEHANTAKSQFLAAASHDLRQPVHAQGLFLQALSQTDLAAPQRRILQNAQTANVASTDMLNTLLDFSRLEAGVITPRPRAFELQPLLDKIENDLAHLADAKRLIYRTPQTDLAIVSDAALLELVLRNLVLNAIRYTERGGVLIGCRRRGTGVSIEVYDTGIGIPVDEREDIFREFYQLGNPERDRHKGLGLGLAIARGIAASLGHPLSLSSRVGSGSVFRILVPRTLDTDLGPGLDPGADDARAADIPETGGLAGARILIVDDDAIVRDAMVALLSGWGCLCWAFEDPTEVARLPWQGPPPDALICDYRLRRGQTGAEAIATLRQHWGRPVPAILVTGDTAPVRMREALDSGIPLIHKPVRPDLLQNALAALIPRDQPPVDPVGAEARRGPEPATLVRAEG